MKFNKVPTTDIDTTDEMMKDIRQNNYKKNYNKKILCCVVFITSFILILLIGIIIALVSYQIYTIKNNNNINELNNNNDISRMIKAHKQSLNNNGILSNVFGAGNGEGATSAAAAATTTGAAMEDDNLSIDTCGLSNIKFNPSLDNKIKVQNVPSEVLPGSQFFTYSFNMLLGKPPRDLLLNGLYRQILRLTFDQTKISAGSEGYLVPDQLDLPSITGICESQMETSEISSTSSTSSIYHTASDSTGSTSAEASISAHGWGFSGSASMALSASHSRSSAASASAEQTTESKTESIFHITRAKLYGATMRWEDNLLFSNESHLTSNPDSYMETSYQREFYNDAHELIMKVPDIKNKDILKFIYNYGTHVIKRGIMGAMCESSTHFSSGYSSQSLSASREQAISQENSLSTSASVSGHGFGVSGSVSGSYSKSSSSSSSNSAETTSQREASSSYTRTSSYCIGEVFLTNSCGEMVGRSNQPALVQNELLPIWNINIFNETISKRFEDFMNEMFDTGASLCGGIAIPAINPQIFNSKENILNWDGTDFTVFWDDSRCFDQYHIGLTILNDSDINNNVLSNKNLGYERREHNTNKYSQFCLENEKIIMTLSMISNAKSGIHISNKFNNGFKSYFSVGPNNGIQFSAANYLITCNDIQHFIYPQQVRFTENRSIRRLRRRTLDIPKKSNGNGTETVFCDGDTENMFVISGLSSSHDTTINALKFESRIDNNKVILDYNTNGAYILGCESPKLTYGTLNIKQNDLTKFSSKHYALNKHIHYDQLYCDSVRVYITTSVYTPKCHMAMWTENESPMSFVLKIRFWSLDSDDNNFCENGLDNTEMKVQYIVFCQS